MYQDFIKNFPVHCDFSPNNLMIWLSAKSDVHGCWLNGNLVLSINGAVFSEKLNSTWYTVLGNNKADDTLDIIFNTAGFLRLEMVPEYFTDAVRTRNNYIIKEDADNKDYILSVEGLMNKAGKEYVWYRRQINHFENLYGNFTEIKELDPLSQRHSTEIIHVLKFWRSIASFSNKGNDAHGVDEDAINRLLKLQPNLLTKHKIIGLYIDGKLEGFTIYHIPISASSMAVGNHIKHNANIERAFDYLIYQTVKKLHENNIEYLNGEQDMGIEGLRYHKSLLRPVAFHKKYSIEPKLVRVP